MEIKVRVPAEVEDLAKARGLRVETCVEKLLTQRANPSGTQRQ